MPYPATPELDRMNAISDKSQKIGEFIDWLRNEKNMEICEDYPVPENGWITDGGWHPTHTHTEQLLADFFQIDLNKIEQERLAILDHLNEIHKES